MAEQEDFPHRSGGIREPDPTLGKVRAHGHALPDSPAVSSEPSSVFSSVPSSPALAPPSIKPPRRQRVVLADPRLLPVAGLKARVELEEQTSWGEMLIKDLVKVQLRTAIWLALLALLILGALPLAFYLVPSFGRLTVIGVPVPWFLLAIAPFPLLFCLGLWYNKLADRHERNFVDMIEN